VARLEEFPSERITFADGRYLVEYCGKLLPLIPVNPDMDIRGKELRPVLVFTEGEHSMGLAVEEIQDIMLERLDTDGDSHRAGVLGVCKVAGKISEVIDTEYFLKLAHPNWFRKEVASDGSPTRVLLVDDSRFFTELMAPMMRASNATVTTANDGQQALEYLEKGESFDVVVSDIEMTPVDGLTLARSIRANPSWRDMHLIALTSHSRSEDRSAALGAGFDDFLTKSNKSALVKTIADFSNHKQELAA
jgi:two-component system chemotaxis sensor kinase CheA